MGVKNAEINADFKSVEKGVKNSYKKVISVKMSKFCTFLLLLLRAKVLSPITFFFLREDQKIETRIL
jgi:hypothetical protein